MGKANINIPAAPHEYGARAFDDIIRTIRLGFAQLNNPGPLQATTLNLSALPTSATGLRSGDIWVDTGAGNVLKIVP